MGVNTVFLRFRIVMRSMCCCAYVILVQLTEMVYQY